MKTLQLILAVSAVFVITGGLLLYQKQNSQQESFTSNIFTVRKPDITAEWVSWKQKFGKSYGNDTEDVQKMKVFGENYNMVQYKNTLPGRTFKLGMTKFADLTKEGISYVRTPRCLPHSVAKKLCRSARTKV